MVIEPLGKIIFIEPVQTGSSTFMVEGDNSLTSQVKVVAVGPEVTWVKPGDMIVANYWGTDEIELDGTKYYFVKESDDYVLAKVSDGVLE